MQEALSQTPDLASLAAKELWLKQKILGADLLEKYWHLVNPEAPDVFRINADTQEWEQ